MMSGIHSGTNARSRATGSAVGVDSHARNGCAASAAFRSASRSPIGPAEPCSTVCSGRTSPPSATAGRAARAGRGAAAPDVTACAYASRWSFFTVNIANTSSTSATARRRCSGVRTTLSKRSSASINVPVSRARWYGPK